MAMHTRPQRIGTDVSTTTLGVAVYGAAQPQTLANEPGACRAWLPRLLHNAAMAARRSPVWAPVYERYRQRGLASTQVLVILARKLARIAFALMKNQSQYHSPLTAGSCTAT